MAYAEFQNLVRTLRDVMKKQKITYGSLAKKLKVSEATIKRFFNAEDGSISRIVEICDCLGLSFSDLVNQAKDSKEKVFTLTEAQEEFFVKNPHCYDFFQELNEEQRSPKEIKEKYRLNQNSLNKYLRALEQIGVLEWLPSDRVRMVNSGSHNWIQNGPLQKRFLFEDNVQFLENSLKSLGEEDRFVTSSDRYIHQDTNRSFMAELRKLATEYRKRAYKDELFYPRAELTRVKWIIAIGPYNQSHRRKISNF